jgi:hypothetical protein
MKAYLLSYETIFANNVVFYKLVYAFTYEQAKAMLIKHLNVKESALKNITNETIEYTI